jgi:hypothetical protein
MILFQVRAILPDHQNQGIVEVTKGHSLAGVGESSPGVGGIIKIRMTGS